MIGLGAALGLALIVLAWAAVAVLFVALLASASLTAHGGRDDTEQLHIDNRVSGGEKP